MMSLEFDYFYGNEAEQFTFYRIPKLLITSPEFKRISDSAKLLKKLQEDADVEDVVPVEKTNPRPQVVHIEKTRVVKTKTATTSTSNSDDYLAQLLNGLDDWDDL